MNFTDSPPSLAVAGAVFVLAGFVKGVLGMGLPTVAMGLLSVFMAPAYAAALLVVPSLVTNVWQIHSGLDAHNETITFDNSATVNASDFFFT